MLIAFAYMDVNEKEKYHKLASGLAENIRKVFGVKPLQVTDQKTAAVPGCDILRIDVDELPMTWRLKAHQLAHALDDQILFTEPDVRFTENILHCFDKQFDVALTDREEETTYGSEKASEVAPYTQGSTFSRSPDFWGDCFEYCKALDRKKQLWFGDMLAIAHVVKSDKYNVGIFPASKINHVPKHKLDVHYPVVHYKGNRKDWLLPDESFRWPDDEMDRAMLASGKLYQRGKLKSALKHVKNFRTAIDVGSHCGSWTLQLLEKFWDVHCFEPLKIHHDLWEKNVVSEFATLHKVALGDHWWKCGINVVKGYSGRSYVQGNGDIQVMMLDDFSFRDVDFIKIDTEGFEYYVCKGGEKTIKENKPVMVVEQKPGHAAKYNLSDKAAVDLLESWGGKVVEEIAGDYIVVF